MQPQQIASQLITIIKPYLPEGAQAQPLSENTDLVTELGISSMHMIDILLEIEDHFNITVNIDEAKELAKVGSALLLIQRKLDELADAQPASQRVASG